MNYTSQTEFPTPPGKIKGFAKSISFGLTEGGSLDQPANYKDAGQPIAGATKIDSSTVLDAMDLGSSHTSAAAVPEHVPQKIKGVLDHVGETTSEVTLFYDGRENRFLFPTGVLGSSGVSYAGALFEIVMRNEQGFLGYDIVHKTEDEKSRREEMGPADLSFLDEIDGGPRTRPDRSRSRRQK
jgi:hypothetical protein